LVPTTMGTTCYFSPERFEPDAHAEPSLGVDEEVVRLDVEVRDAAGVQMEEAHEAPRSHLGQRRLGEPAAPSVLVEDGVQVIVRFLVSVRLSGPISIIDFWYRLLKWADTKNLLDY
jgi:hypothetical protein